MNIVKILEECRDMVNAWGSYTGEYFLEKHGFEKDIKQIDEWIAEAKVREHIDSVLPDEDIEMICPECGNEMKEYVMFHRCRKLMCRFMVKKKFPIK